MRIQRHVRVRVTSPLSMLITLISSRKHEQPQIAARLVRGIRVRSTTIHVVFRITSLPTLRHSRVRYTTRDLHAWIFQHRFHAIRVVILGAWMSRGNASGRTVHNY